MIGVKRSKTLERRTLKDVNEHVSLIVKRGKRSPKTDSINHSDLN
jgi:hypothetical protein